VVSKGQEKCLRCFHRGRRCDLAGNWDVWDKLREKDEVLSDKIADVSAEMTARIARLRRERKEIRRKMKEIGDTEALNIEQLEDDERQQAEIDTLLNSPLSPLAAGVPSLDDFLFQTSEVTAGSSGGSQ